MHHDFGFLRMALRALPVVLIALTWVACDGDRKRNVILDGATASDDSASEDEDGAVVIPSDDLVESDADPTPVDDIPGDVSEELEVTDAESLEDLLDDVNTDVDDGDQLEVFFPDAEGQDIELQSDAELDDADDGDVPLPLDIPDIPVTPTGKVALEVDGQVLGLAGPVVTLADFVVGPGSATTATLIIRNAGTVPFTVTSMELLAKNVDGSLKNPLVALGAPGKQVPVLPADVLPAAQVPTAKLTLPVSFAPQSLDEAVAAGGTDATLKLTLANADVAVITIRIAVPQFIPDVSISPLSLVFTEATLAIPETRSITMENVGNAPLYVLAVQLVPPSDRFVVAPLSATTLGPAGSANPTVTLEVTYKPVFSSTLDSTTLVISTDDPDQPTVEIPLSSTFETTIGESPCVLSFPGQESGALDFSDAKVGAPKLLTVQLENVGVGVCTVNGISVPEDPSSTAFYVASYSQAPDQAPQPISQFPLGVGAGYKVLIDVTYAVTSAAKSATLTIDLADPAPQLIEIPMIGGGPKPCFAMGPGSNEAPELLEFAGNPGDVVTRHIALYSCGEAPVGFGPITVVDPGEAAPAFTVETLAGEIPASGIVWLPISSTFEPEATDIVSELNLPYSLTTGPAKVKITLRRRLLGTTKLPTADPGNEGKYPSLVAGQPFTLDGTASTSGTLPLASSGYLWTLVAKPAASLLIVAGPPGPPLRVVTPDVPGSYTFALVVKSAGSLPWYSPERTVTVNVN